jgi:hypothetical protein
MEVVRWLTNRLHVSLSDREVVREFYKRYNHLRGREHRATRHKCYRHALECHHENQELFRKVAKGDLT